MLTFSDTSGLYALLDQDDNNHSVAANFWRAYDHRENVLVASNYIILECHTLIQRWSGMEAVSAFQSRIVPLLSILWITETIHGQAIEQVLAANRRQLSFVDCSSFAIMRSRGIAQIFAFDQHFAEQGFGLLPERV